MAILESFSLIDVAADCCHLYEPADTASRATLYITGLDVHQRGKELMRTRQGGNTPQACARLCSRKRNCLFFSVHRWNGECVLCSMCELQNSSYHIYQYRVKLHAPTEYSSWRLGHGRLRQESGNNNLEQLFTALQGAYSRSLYGGPDLVDRSQLRIIWLELLPDRALELLVKLGVCRMQGIPLIQPLFAPISYGADINPANAIWVGRAKAHPVANYSWVEVTHCAEKGSNLWASTPWLGPSGRQNRRSDNHSWTRMPMWLYVAPGSGVSINVSRPSTRTNEA